VCGRFAFYSPHEAVVRLFGVTEFPQVEARYNIAPTQFVASVRAGRDGVRRLAMLYWGLVPSWSNDKAIGARMINARGETLREKPSFRSAYRRRRCLVLADGYYEWQRSGPVKQPYFISFEDGRPFGMAGLWEAWRDPASGEPLESCCIVTTSPASEVAQVHDRMPVIVPPGSHAEWLDPANEAVERLDRLIEPWRGGGLQAQPVSRRVNDARNQGPDLVAPLGSTPAGE